MSTIVLYNFVLAGRTIFALILILVAVAFLYKSFTSKGIINIKTIFWISFVILIIIVFYNYDTFGIKSTFENSNFYNRFFGEYSQDIYEDNRLETKLYYLKNFEISWLGGGAIRNEIGLYAHDIYLDTYDDASIFALISIVIYIIASLSRVISCLKNKHLNFNTKQLIFCIYISANIQFFLEPVLHGEQWLFASYCLIDGIVACVLNKTRELDLYL